MGLGDEEEIIQIVCHQRDVENILYDPYYCIGKNVENERAASGSEGEMAIHEVVVLPCLISAIRLAAPELCERLTQCQSLKVRNWGQTF